jgi:NlpC/P60 family putative phage cell wall peptidase
MIVKEALTWVGTPYHNQARIKGVGVDCANLIAGIAEKCGYKPVLLEPYSIQWHLHNSEEKMIDILKSYGCIETLDVSPGTLITFQFGQVSGHIGIMVSATTFVHADVRVGKVTEVTLGGAWQRRLSGAFKFPELK